MASLYGKRVKDTFKSLLKLNDNDIISATEKQITDGLGGSTSVFIDTYGNLRASKYKVTGAGSGAFLKGDGSLDTNAYLTEALAASTYLKITDAAATYLTITNAAATYLPIGADTDDIPEGTTNKYFTNSRAINSTLTGFTPIIGTVTSSDTVISAIEKIYASLGGGGGGGGDFVPYIGADDNVDLGEFGMLSGFIQFDTTPTGTPTAQGTEYWDENEETVALVMNGTTGHYMQDMFFNVKNQTGFTIAKGTNVGFAGTLGSSGRLLIQEFTADGSMPAEYYMGVTNEEILDGADGKVLAFGKIKKIDTSAFPEGTLLYCSDVAGNFTDIKPTSPMLTILVAAVVHSDDTNGVIQVRPTYAQKISDASDVRIADLADDDILQWKEVNLSWENINIFTALGATDVGKALLSIPPAGLTIPPTTKPRGIRINVDNTVTAKEVGDQGYIPYYDETDFYINSPIFVDSYGKVIVNGEVGFYEFTVNGEFKADNLYVNTFSKIIAETADDSLSFSTYDGTDWIQNLRLYNDGSIKQSAVTNALIGTTNTGVLRAGTKTDLETILGAPATSGTLTANYVPVATDVDSITDSMLYQDGSFGLVVNGTSAAYKFQVNGTFGADEINIFSTGKITANLVSGYITNQVLDVTYKNVLRLHKNQDIQQFKIFDGIVYADSSGYLSEATSGQIIAGLGYVPYNSTNPDGFIAPGTFFATSPLSWDLYTNTISMSQASDLNNGWLSASDWTTFNNKGNGSVTSVAMSVPTGLSVSGSPITTSGTLAVTFTAGYSIPTTAKQSEWDSAYSNRITSASSPLSISSNVISISQANTSTNGFLSSTDWNTFNGKQNALGYTPVPTTRTLTINGTGYDLSADRSWTISGTISGLTSGYVPYANTTSTLSDSPIYRHSSGRIIVGGVTDDTVSAFQVIGAGKFSSTVTATYFNGALQVDGTTSAGRISYNGAYGVLIQGKTGSIADTAIFTPAGSVVWENTTATTNSRFYGNVTVASIIRNGGTSGQFLKADGSVDSTSYQPLLTNPITGSLTAGFVPLANTTTVIGNSQIYDNGSAIGIGTTSAGSVYGERFNVTNTATGRIVVNHTNTSGARQSDVLFTENSTAFAQFGAVYDAPGLDNRFWIRGIANIPIVFATNDTERFRITASGYIGNTSTPELNVHWQGTNGLPATTGTTQTGVLRLSQSAGQSILDFGINGGTGAWLQVTNRTDLSLTYPLLLQPNGNSVIVGTYTGVSGGGALQVTGDINVTGTFKINGTAITTSGITGSGTTNYITKWNSSSAVTNSVAYDDGTNITIGGTSSLYKLTVTPLSGINFGAGVGSYGGTNNAVSLNAVNGSYTSIPMIMNGSVIGFFTGYTEAGKIDASQNWTLGTSSVTGGGKLQVNGDVNITGAFKISNVTVPTGSGTSGYINFWSGSSTMSGSSNLYWDNTNKLLGLGTSSPTLSSGRQGMTIRGSSSGAELVLQSTNSTNGTYDGLSIAMDGDTAYIFNKRNGDLQLGANNARRATLTVGGDFDITGTYKVNGVAIGGIGGTGSSGYFTYWTASSTVASSPLYNAGGSTIAITLGGTTAGTAPLTLDSYGSITYNMASNYNAGLFKYSGTTVGSISVNNTSTAYNTSSDYRLKEDLRSIKGIELLSKINVYDFAWKIDGSRSYGVMAHELQEVIPYAVTGIKDGKDFQSVDYSKLVPIVIQATKEHEDRIKVLERQNRDQQNEIEMLKLIIAK